MSRLTEAQEAAVKAGTHVVDAVHGFVPKRPVSAARRDSKGNVEVDSVSSPPSGDLGLDPAAVIKAQGAAVKESEKKS